MGSNRKRRESEPFSIAFLDCICCGFGAMLLVFVLTVSQQKQVDKETVEEVQARVDLVNQAVSLSQTQSEEMARRLAQLLLELESRREEKRESELTLADRQRQLLLLLRETGLMQDALATLLDEKESLPSEEEANIPIPNISRRQYLTGVNLQGDYVLFLVRVSGSMLDETIAGASARLGDPDYLKREAPKWQRVVRSLEWMIASLTPEQRFKIYLFNDETVPLLPNRADEWFRRNDQQALREILDRLDDIVPRGGANLERAMTTLRFLPRLPDSVVLFTDGLPTLSDSMPREGEVSERDRQRFFELAERQRPPQVPISTILFPIDGDPLSSFLYWDLANKTRGAMVSPSRDWPES